VLPYPKRLVDNLNGTALRFGQVKLVDERTHMNAVVMSQFFSALLGKGSFAHDFIDQAYVHDASDAVVFYLCLRNTRSMNDFERKASAMMQGHALMLELQEEQQPAQGAVSSKKGAGSKRPRPSGKLGNCAHASSSSLELKRSIVPAHMYAATAVMCRPLTWSLCVTCRDDWDYVAGHFVAHLLSGIGDDVVIHDVSKLVDPAPQPQAAADNQGSAPGLPPPPPAVDDGDGGMEDADDDGDAAMQDASAGAPAAAQAVAAAVVRRHSQRRPWSSTTASVVWRKCFRSIHLWKLFFGSLGLKTNAELRSFDDGQGNAGRFPWRTCGYVGAASLRMQAGGASR
jgi:hypothetical protein